MCAFYLVDVSRGREPNRRLAFGGCLQTLAFFRATHFLSLRAEKRGPQKILLYFWGKGVCKHKTGDCRLRRLTGQKRSIRRVAISRKGHRIIKPTQDTFVLAWRKKAHTSIRVSIVAPTMRFQKCSVRREQPPLTSPFVRIPRGPLYNALTASEERSKRLYLRKSNAADIANNRIRSVKCKALAQSTDNNNFPLSLLYLLKTML